MIDLTLVTTQTDLVVKHLLARNFTPWPGSSAADFVDRIVTIDREAKEATTAAQTAQSEKNRISKEIGVAMRDGTAEKAVQRLKVEVMLLDETIQHNKMVADERVHSRDYYMMRLPNLPDDNVPEGADETDNLTLNEWGAIPTIENPLDHVEIAARMGHGLMDFEAASAMSGARFVVLRGAMARLERAIGDFMLDQHTAAGWLEVSPPTLVQEHAMEGTGQFPKFKDDAYETNDGLYLIPTAEVSLTNLYRDQIIDAAMPIRMVAQTVCYRREAGSAGRDTKGMIRQHQFKKVELVTICAAEVSKIEHLGMLERAQDILQKLKLPYRTVLLCTGDMGFSASITYDLEVWLPSQNTYREISSISNCGDFQARRMKARWKPDPKGKTEFVHTLNGSGLAVGRTLVAILENGQRPDGSVDLPEVLWPYVRASRIAPNGSLVDDR